MQNNDLNNKAGILKTVDHTSYSLQFINYKHRP